MSKKRTKYYHADEVAELLGVTTDEIRGMLKRNELKGHKLGRRWLIDMKQPVLENIVSSHEEEEKQEPSFRYIKDSDHEEVIYEKLHSVQSSLYIATANFKNVKFHGITLVSILNEMVSKGVKITIICSKLHVKETYDFEVVVCPRNHMKMFIFDEKYLYIGSANLTPAAIAPPIKAPLLSITLTVDAVPISITMQGRVYSEIAPTAPATKSAPS